MKIRGETEGEPEYIGALIFVETTRRKAYGHPLHTKTAREVFAAFMKFLKEIDFKITKLSSDSGLEYSLIKKNNDKKKIFNHFQVVATEGRHTTLSRVDCFIRTLRGMIRDYYSNVKEGNWKVMLEHLINHYNNSPHGSLFLIDPKDGEKIFIHTKIKFF